MMLSKIALALAAAGLVAGSGAAAYSYEFAHGAATAARPEGAIPVGAMPARRVALPDFSTIAQGYGPAIVNISTEETVKAQGQGQNPFADDPYFQFFRGLPMPRGDLPLRGQGSGFIVSANGLILTNAHVVRAAEVTVKLTDRREFRAKVLGTHAYDRQVAIAVRRLVAIPRSALQVAVRLRKCIPLPNDTAAAGTPAKSACAPASNPRDAPEVMVAAADDGKTAYAHGTAGT